MVNSLTSGVSLKRTRLRPESFPSDMAGWATGGGLSGRNGSRHNGAERVCTPPTFAAKKPCDTLCQHGLELLCRG